jgi:LPXTG-motif cell wall-anchored protein
MGNVAGDSADGWIPYTYNGSTCYYYTKEIDVDSDTTINIKLDCFDSQVLDSDNLVQVEGSTSAADEDSFLILDEPYKESTISAPLWSSDIDVKELPISGSRTDLTYEAADGSSKTYNGVVTYKYYVREVLPDGYTASYLYTINGDSNVVDNTQLGYDYLYLFSPSDIVDGKESVITIENYPKEDDGVSLPNTGGRGTIVYTAAGLLMLAFAACGLYIKIKRQGGLHE